MTNPTSNLSPLKQALVELREMRAQLDKIDRERSEPIAVIGIGLRFPGGASDAASFWRILRDGVDAITEVPPARWDIDAFYNPDPEAPGSMSSRYGAFLEGVDLFDTHFFGISPRESVEMDPQQRLLLEVSWEALEHAGQAPGNLAGSRTGVYIGISNSDYLRLLFADPQEIDAYTVTGNTTSIAAGRLAYILGLHGPALAVDTACSSSLVAAHLACQDLRTSKTDMALVGGVNLILTPEISINFSKSRVMSPDGRCKTFDAGANGYVRGEGCAVVVLKRLSDALANRDHVLAIIRGTAINHDGRSGGLTVPNGPAQESVIRAALADAHVEAGSVTYVEAHGTGTPLGDPIEVRALGAALCSGRSTAEPLVIGSVKTNIGHLEAVAGLAGLIKVVLSLQHREIPAHLHFQQPNPHIAWDELPIVVPTQRGPWQPIAGRRIAGVSSFGLSGTNAHLIVEEAPPESPDQPGLNRPRHILTFSAKSEKGLTRLSERMAEHLAAFPTEPLADVCFSANTGRSHFGHRLAVVADSSTQAREKLAILNAGRIPTGAFRGDMQNADPPQVAFLFTGHGSLYTGMGRELYHTQPTYRNAIDTCDRALRSYLDRSLSSILYPAQDTPEAQSILSQMRYAQPALFALEYALAALWHSWGIEPAAVLGHSLGEYAAACVAGLFSLEDGLKLAAVRGQLMQSLPDDGEMVTVFAGEATVAEEIAPYADEVAIAAINSLETVVISGRRDAVRQVVASLKARKIRVRTLPVPQAAHSPLIDPLLGALEQTAEAVIFKSSQVVYVSGMTGRIAGRDEIAQASYWRRHMREPVRFAEAMQSMYAQGYRVFIEIGPNPTLLSLGQRCIPAEDTLWLPSLREGWTDWTQILESLAALYIHGAAVNWTGFEHDYASGRRRVALPTYPWEHQSYWLGGEARVQRVEKLSETEKWESVVAAGDRQAQQAPLDLSLSTYAAKWQCLENLTTAYIAAALRELGAFVRAGESLTAERLLATHGVSTTYHNLLARWLRLLSKHDYLQSGDDSVFTSVQPLAVPGLEALLDTARVIFSDAPALLEYVMSCGNRLPAVLTGRETPLETLFPNGSFSQAEGLYQHWSVSRYFNGIISALVQSAIQARQDEGLIQIIEVGAGTGSTTASVLPVLPPRRTRYTFTDVSGIFLSEAEQKFRDYSFVKYSILNVECDPLKQGYAQSNFDIVVAANVLHAATNVAEALQHVRSLLSEGGLLILYEATRAFPWYDITTGLIEGWQRFDDGLRVDHPLLCVEQWQAAVCATGFDAVAAFPPAVSPAEVLGQHVLVARASLSAKQGVQPALSAHVVRYGATIPEHDPQPRRPGTGVADDKSVGFLSQLRAAPTSEQEDMLTDYVRDHVSRILRLDPAAVLDHNARLMDVGIDSLMAVELRNRLGRSLALEQSLPATLIFDYPTVRAIATYLARDVLVLKDVGAARSSATQSSVKSNDWETIDASGITEMSDEEVAALLQQRLASRAK